MKISSTVSIAIVILSAAVAVAQTAPAKNNAVSGVPAPISPAQATQRAGGSLFRASASMTPDANSARMASQSFLAIPDPQPRTLKKHDLVTIIVRESTQFKSEGSTDLKKDASIDARIDEWIKLQIRNVAVQGGGIGPTAPSIKASGARDFKGEASVDRTDSLTLRVTGEVLDVKPNGTLVLQAKQKIKHDDEEQEFVLAGVCRVEDISPDNTILSTQLYDKQLTTTTKGAVRDTTKRGWVPKLLDVINPF